MTVRRLALLLLVGSMSAFASTHPVDDSASRVRQPNVRTAWDDGAPYRGASTGITGTFTVDVELDTTPWAGQPGRLYLVLAPTPAIGPVSATWTSQNGVLLPGTVRAGDRTLVLAGPIPSGRVRDTLTFTVHADGALVARPEQLSFTFEVDAP